MREERTERSERQLTPRTIMQIETAKDLNVYKLAYEEKYALTSQIRRSSRSVCLNLREALAKRRYEPHFVSKPTDCDGEANETDSSLDLAKDCGYVSLETHQRFVQKCTDVRRMLGGMIKKPQGFVITE
jgi:four helix bundle protein